MKVLDSKLYRIVEVSVNFFLLNLLWLLACLPVITFFPSTIAMFGVIRDWHMKKEVGVMQPFFQHFLKNFKVSVGLTIIWAPLTVILFTNIQLLQPTASIVGLVMTVVIGFILLLFASTSVYLIPVTVHFELPMIQLIQNSFFIAISQIKYTMLSLALLFIAGYLIYQIPIMMIFITSLVSYFIYVSCYEAFKKVGAVY
ncbi:YesL family protein [Halalkalibacter flavus]|jgi:uncharacterized membrane protein YesL|uniref:YesL family protein n=1 Tax=Halalkalibacter flavus TaxID=3090668 RepID=UPI002FC69729